MQTCYFVYNYLIYNKVRQNCIPKFPHDTPMRGTEYAQRIDKWYFVWEKKTVKIHLKISSSHIQRMDFKFYKDKLVLDYLGINITELPIYSLYPTEKCVISEYFNILSWYWTCFLWLQVSSRNSWFIQTK